MPSAEELMVAAAERIGAEKGLGAMSLRAVQAAAGQRNKSAAQYHFGTRDGLIAAVLAARMGPINQHRARLLDELGDDADLRALVEALVRPLADAVLAEGPSYWARFVLQGYADPAVATTIQTNLEGAAFREVRHRLADHLDDVPAPLRHRRVDHAVGLVILSLAGTEHALATGRRDALGVPVGEAVEDLIDMCCGLLAVPPTRSDGAPGRP